MDDADERSPALVCLDQVWLELSLQLMDAEAAKIDLHRHGRRRGGSRDLVTGWLQRRRANPLETVQRLADLDDAHLNIGHRSVDGEDVAFLVERHNSHPVSRLDLGRFREANGREVLAAKLAGGLLGR